MALFKKILTENGVLIKYHRIDTIAHESGMTKVSVLSYADNEYRIKEKESKINKKRYGELTEMIFAENEKEEPDTEKVIEWTDEANSLSEIIKDIDLSVLKIEMKYEGITDLSLSNLYMLLKQEELFANSKDV